MSKILEIDTTKQKVTPLNYIEGSGIFIKTHEKYKLNDRVFFVVKQKDSIKTAIGTVVWTTPKNNFSQFDDGIGLYLTDDYQDLKLSIFN